MSFYNQAVQALDVHEESQERGKELIKAALESYQSWTRSHETFVREAITRQNSLAICDILDLVPRHTIASATELLHFAVLLPQTSGQLVRTMLERMELVDLDSAFAIAASRANREVCEELLVCGANIEPQYENKVPTPLHDAAKRGDYELVTMMLKYNASVNRADDKERTPLHRAAQYGHTRIVDCLLANSASLDALDRYERTPLFSACARGHRNTALRLWSAGSKLSHRDIDGRTMLHAAAHKGHLSIIDMLLSAGISPLCEDNSSKMPIHEAAANGWAFIVDRLLHGGANPNAKNRLGKTSLHFACESRNAPETVVSLLLKWGADAFAVDEPKNGRTALHVAAEHSTLRVLSLFANKTPQLFNEKDAQGRNVLDYIERDYQELDKMDKINFMKNLSKYVKQTSSGAVETRQWRSTSLPHISAKATKADLPGYQHG
jgi:ankyrin repeat protein